MRRILAVMALMLFLPTCALAAQIALAIERDEAGTSTLAVFSAQADEIDAVPGQQPQPDAVMLAIDAQIEARFAQQKAQLAVKRGTVTQTGSVWQDGRTASMALIWQGEQADGSYGCSAMGLNLNLETGEELLLEQLFSDWDGALERMEAILESDVADGMSDYMEYGDLLPMPTEQYSVDAYGLTVYWPEDRYRYFDGTSGSVTFYWHELSEFIGEESPVYALACPDAAYNVSEIEALCMSGEVTSMVSLKLGELLGSAAGGYRLADPDYTTDALVYPLERVRGYAVEIPKYAETQEEQTPICAIRASRVSMAGLLTTGKTTDAELIALLGEPDREIVFDEDDALDALLEPGTSLLYEVAGRVLQAHVGEDGVLSCLILRDAMPERLY